MAARLHLDTSVEKRFISDRKSFALLEVDPKCIGAEDDLRCMGLDVDENIPRRNIDHWWFGANDFDLGHMLWDSIDVELIVRPACCFNNGGDRDRKSVV